MKRKHATPLECFYKLAAPEFTEAALEELSTSTAEISKDEADVSFTPGKYKPGIQWLLYKVAEVSSNSNCNAQSIC